MSRQSDELRALVAAGRCRSCRGDNPDVGLRTQCPACRRKAAEYRKGLRDRRKAAGVCLDCEATPLAGHQRCERCHRRMLAAAKLHTRPRRKARQAPPGS